MQVDFNKISNQTYKYKHNILFSSLGKSNYFLTQDFLKNNPAIDNKDTFEAKTKINADIKTGAIITTASAITAGGIFLAIKSGKSSAVSKEVKKLLSKNTIKVFENQIKLFPKDIEYRKNLLSAIGINIDSHMLIRSIIGPQEYKSLLKEFHSCEINYVSGKTLITKLQDEHDLTGVTNKTLRANMHIHTLHSDGKMSVSELLEQAANYANDVAESMDSSGAKAKHAPFTVAITDHDTLEACKEAVEMIIQNPEKYKNLRVVLGCELSVENKTIPQKLHTPIETHTLLHAINPFDKKLNLLLDNKKNERLKLIEEFINKASEKLSAINPSLTKKLTYEDSKDLYPALKHRVTHIDLATKDYIQFRTIFSECFEKNPEIQAMLKSKGINHENIKYFEPKEKYFKEITQDFGDSYWKKYQKALIKYTSELLEIPESEASGKIVVTPEMGRLFNEIQQLTYDFKPKIEPRSGFVDMEDAINLIKESDYGYIGIAHPGLTKPEYFLEDSSQRLQAMSDLFKFFKEKGGEKALFVEIHYPYFGALAENPQHWLVRLRYYAKECGFLFSGGLDSHGKSIFYGHK